MSWLSDLFKGEKGTTVEQEAMLTPEQKAAMSLLSSFSSTGKLGNYQTGTEYSGALGDFDPTELEKISQSKLLELITGAKPEMFQLGTEEIKKLLTTDKYDPYNEKGGVYSGFKKNVLREEGEAADRLYRDQAIMGDLYSTATAKERGLLGERSQDALTGKLAELYQDFSNKKLAGASTAAQMGLQEEGIDTARIGLGMSLGALERVLKDAEAKAKYAEWARARGEYSQQLDAAKSVMGANVQWGVKSFTTPDSPSPFSMLLNQGLQIAGQVAESYLSGGAYGAGLKSSGYSPYLMG